MVLNQVNVEPIQLDHNEQSTDTEATHAGTYELHANNALGTTLLENDLLHVNYSLQFGNAEFLKHSKIIVPVDIRRVSFSITEEEWAN